MASKRLIFFVTADLPSSRRRSSPPTSWPCCNRGGIGGRGPLAADAVLVADPGYVATVDASITLRERVDRAAVAGIAVSVCPESVDAHGILDEQLEAIGARPRPFAEILAGVADGRSTVVAI